MGILDIVIGPLTDVLKRVLPDPQARAQAQLELVKMQQAGELAQLEAAVKESAAQNQINAEEAKSSNLFVSGWRPSVGWICALALGFQYIARPLVQWGFSVKGYAIPVLPGLDDNLWQLLLGMLGLGTLRSYEKIRGVTK